MNHEKAYLPSELWLNTRGYIEKVCKQINSCFLFNLPDAAAVLIRRLVETLIIESFIYEKRESEIKDTDGQFLMLSGLVKKVLEPKGLTLGRDSRGYLTTIKEFGDRSAHKRNYNAIKADLDKIHIPLRVIIDELINISHIKKIGVILPVQSLKA